MKTLIQTYQAKQTEDMPLSAIDKALRMPKKQRDQLRSTVVATRSDLLTRQETLRNKAEKAIARKAKARVRRKRNGGTVKPWDRKAELKKAFEAITKSLAPLRAKHTRAVRSYAQALEAVDVASLPTLSPEVMMRRIKAMHRGVLLWHGPSQINGEPVFALIQFGSGNRKTGSMRQTYILSAERSPLAAVQDRLEESICGTCPHRPQADGSRSCYVDLRSLTNVWQSITGSGIRTGIATEGRYLTLQEAASLCGVDTKRALELLGMGERVRLGTYGDPAAIPAALWSTLTSQAETWTGYTHQWQNKAVSSEQRQALKPLVRASVDDAQGYQESTSTGWVPFVVTPDVETGRALRALGPMPVALCPASEEAGQRVTCAACPIGCKGDQGKPLAVFIPAHGPVTATRSYEGNAAKRWAV